MNKQVTIYTDGACSGNPGPGGYGTVIQSGQNRKELSGGFSRTTNNRMELLAVIKGLEVLTEPCAVTLYSDSRYIVDAVNKGWARAMEGERLAEEPQGEGAEPGLWGRLLELLDYHDVEIRWVRGHAGNPGNERADKLAVAASRGERLAVDECYETQSRSMAPRLSD